MVCDRRARRWWRRPEAYGAALLAAAIFFPVLLWNARHDWASFAFQGTRRFAEQHAFGPPLLLGSAFLLLSPTGAIAAFMLLRRRAPASSVEESTARQRAWRPQQISLGVPLAVFTLFRRARVEELGPLRTGELRLNGRFVRRYYYRFASGYSGNPRPARELPRAP